MPYASAHTEAKPIVKGWCPGALTPMLSGDGLLMRAKILGSRLDLAQASEIAAIARDCGNGRIDLSQRAQLQLRGVTEETHGAAMARLDAIGLLARDPWREAALNILASPAAGVADALTARLAAALTRDELHRRLPAKFLFLIDDGGPLGLAGVAADIRLERHGDGIAVVADGARDVAAICAADAAVDAAASLAQAFVAFRKERAFERRRMRAMVGEIGVEPLFRAAGLDASPYRSDCVSSCVADALAPRARGESGVLCVAAPFGRMTAAQFAGLVDAARRAGCSELRLTPWRAIAAPLSGADAATQLREVARDFGFIVEPDDPRLAIVACPGAPECSQAQGETRTDIERLAPLARRLAPHGVGVHVSGCAKGCALPFPAPATLIAGAHGGFDLVFDGEAGAAPMGFGRNLSEIEALLGARLEGTQG